MIQIKRALITLLVLLFFNLYCYSEIESYLAICTMAKDERDLPEWIEYHKRLGVNKIYMFDHNSSEPFLNEIYPYVQSGLVEYRFVVNQTRHFLNPIYRKCLNDFGHLHTWMAFIDVDEFIVV